jgi:hypothetical protein
MKTYLSKFTILFLILLFSGFNVFGQVPNYVPTNGLVGYWPFNGNANDESGNGLNGIVTGASLTTDRNGAANSAYNFDVSHWSWGSGGDKIFIPFHASLNVSNITVSAWFNRNTNGTMNQGLTVLNRFQFGYSNPNGQTWGMTLDQNSSLLMNTWILQSASNNNQVAIGNEGSFINLNQWYNVIFTFDGTNLKQYINGVLVDSDSSSGFSINTIGNSGISIGVSDQANGHWSPFGGKIDDIGIWNRALNECEIQSLCQSQLNSASGINAGLDQTVCEGDYLTLIGSGGSNYQWNNSVVDGVPFSPTSSQDYILYGEDVYGCTGSDTVSVTILANSSSTQVQTALDTYNWPANNQIYSQSGIYIDTLINTVGCDSVVTLNLTLNYTDINELNNFFTVFPNPTTSFVTINLNYTLYDNFALFDPLGRMLLSGQLTGFITDLDLSKFAKGNYLLRVGNQLHPVIIIKN